MMKKLLLCLVLGIAAVCSAEDSAFRKGAAYLLARQGQDGSWGRHPAITGLVCMALNGTHKDAVEKGLQFVSQSEKLLTLGIKPNRPETGYGYIQIAEQAGENFYKVKTFTEKPELELAKVFVESGEFYWNSGLFMWNVNTIIKAGEELLPELAAKLEPGKDVYGTPDEKKFINENFPACPNVSIDFGIMEKADNVYVSLGDFGWSDLGTWGSLYDLSPKDENENVVLKCQSLLYNSRQNIVVLPKGKLAVIDGLEGYLVAESDNVLLICKKDEEHAIRKYVNDAQIKMGEDYI